MNVALMLAMLGTKAPTTLTFTTSQTWVAPISVSQLVRVVGSGQPGTAPTATVLTQNVCNITYSSDSGDPDTTTAGSVYWDSFQGFAPSIASTINAGDTFTGLSTASATVYGAGPRYSLSSGTFSASNVLPGTASVITGGGWATSGLISASGTSSVRYSTGTGGATGATATAFGYSFPGGTSTIPTPVTSTYTNVPVTPLASYSIVVPAGGSVQITFY